MPWKGSTREAGARRPCILIFEMSSQQTEADARQRLTKLTNDELRELQDALTTEFERRGLAPPAASEALAPERASRPDSIAAALDAAAQAPVPDLHAKDALLHQLPTAFAGYREVANQLNHSRGRSRQVLVAGEGTVASELAAWLTDDKLDFIADAQEADPALRFTLVATPNVSAHAKQITAVARAFGVEQPHETYVWEELYGMYTPDELSGADRGDRGSAVFSLVPSRMDGRLYGSVRHQRDVLADMRLAMPAIHVPSLLESVTYWFTLRAQHDRLADSTAFDLTYVRHFDLPEKLIGGFNGVPSSCAGGGGGPSLSYSRAGVGGPGRVALG